MPRFCASSVVGHTVLRSVGCISITSSCLVSRRRHGRTCFISGTSNILYNVSITVEIFRLLSSSFATGMCVRSNSGIGGNSLVTRFDKGAALLLGNREATLGLLRRVSKVTATATGTMGLYRKAGTSVTSAEGALPSLHTLRGCTMAYNKNGGRHFGLSSYTVLGSGRVSTKNNVAKTMGGLHKGVNRAIGVRIRAHGLSRMGRTIGTKTSVVVLSGVSYSAVGGTIRVVNNGTLARTSNKVASRAVPNITTYNMSVVSVKTLARSIRTFSVSVGVGGWGTAPGV